MSSSPDVPKLVMSVSGGPGTALGAAVTWAGQTFASVEVEPVGTGGHHAPEDQPDAIGTAVSRWLERHKLAAAS
jgi:haloalkane dehalogenase